MLLCSLGLEKPIFQGTKMAFGGLSLVRISRIFEDPVGSGSRWRFGARGPTRVVVVLFLACFLFQITVNAQVKEIRRVLTLSDLGAISSPGFAEIDRAISEALHESPYQVELYYESLEVTLFPDELYRRRFREELFTSTPTASPTSSSPPG